MHNSFKKNLKIVFKKTSFLKNFFSSNQANGGVNSFKKNFFEERMQNFIKNSFNKNYFIQNPNFNFK